MDARNAPKTRRTDWIVAGVLMVLIASLVGAATDWWPADGTILQQGRYTQPHRVVPCYDQGDGTCSTTATPPASGLPSGASTAANQALQLSAERSAAVSLGGTSDSQATNAVGSWSVIALLKGAWSILDSARGYLATIDVNMNATAISAEDTNEMLQCLRPAVNTKSADATATTSTAVDANCSGNAYWSEIMNLDRTADVTLAMPDGGTKRVGPLRSSGRVCKVGNATPDNFTVTSVDGSSLVNITSACAS